MSLFIVAIGMAGRWVTDSSSLLNTSFLALALNVNWLFGFILSHRVKNECQRVQYANLNGQVGFELLILYSQIQILVLVLIFIYSLTQIR